MREGTEAGELGRSNHELRELDPGERLRGSATGIAEAIERGESYGYHAERIVSGLRELLEHRLQDVIGAIEHLRGAVEQLRPALGGFGEQLAGGLEGAQRLLERGQEWMRAHPEVVDAALRLAVLGAVAAVAPEAIVAVLRERPEYLLEPVAVIAEHVARAQP